MNHLSKIYAFDDFQFDADRLALYHKDRLVKVGDKKTMQVLAVLLLNPNKLTAHNEIIDQVWHDNPLGVTSGHIGQYIKKLRKVFAEYAPEKIYIETVKGRGYLFVGEISENENKNLVNLKPESEIADNSVKKIVTPFVFPKYAVSLVALIPIFLLFFAAWTWFGENDESEIRRVVKESQLYESLVLYKNPSLFNESDLDRYWTKELEINNNYDRQRIREGVKKLKDENRRYGTETKCEQFEFQSVEINKNGDFAVVKTLEKWFIAVYFDDGTLQRNKYVGPYFVSYIVRKTNGQWLIEKSNTARVTRPTPRISDIVPISEIKPKQQFFVKITGQDFEAETIYLEVIGTGCEKANPCKVPNSALREMSKMSDTTLDKVPLTLDSGDFQIYTRNGDSPASNPVYLKVP